MTLDEVGSDENGMDEQGWMKCHWMSCPRPNHKHTWSGSKITNYFTGSLFQRVFLFLLANFGGYDYYGLSPEIGRKI